MLQHRGNGQRDPDLLWPLPRPLEPNSGLHPIPWEVPVYVPAVLVLALLLHARNQEVR